MEQQIKEMYEQRLAKGEMKKMVTDATIKKHAVNLSKLNGKKVDDVNEVSLGSFDEIIENIKALKGRTGEPIGLASQHSYLSSVIVCLRCQNPDDFQSDDRFKSLMEYINPKSDFMKRLNEHKSGARNRDVPDQEKIHAIMKDYIASDSGDIDMKLILQIYLTLPLRLEVADLEYLTPRKYTDLKKKDLLTANYIVKSKGMSGKLFFSFNDYKTANKYGEKHIPVTDQTTRGLLFEKLGEMEPNKRVFGDLSRNTLSKKVTNFFKAQGMGGVTPTSLAKALLNKELGGEAEQAVIKKQKRLAKERGHGLGTQAGAYVAGA